MTQEQQTSKPPFVMASQVDASRLAAEQHPRLLLIARQLMTAGWSVQDKKNMNLFAAEGVAVREIVKTNQKDVGEAHVSIYPIDDQRALSIRLDGQEQGLARLVPADRRRRPWSIRTPPRSSGCCVLRPVAGRYRAFGVPVQVAA